MPQLMKSNFTKYHFSAEEDIAASSFSDLQTQFIQTRICELAESKLALVVNSMSFNMYIQDEAYIRGQLDALQWLLDLSDTSAREAVKAAVVQSQIQSHTSE